ncbi:MAG: DUF1292 domain-containing protein [Bacteroidales bacterium]|nr:DUF1292 domain-containing protein [Bacteroidales bacterium]MCM1414790.1 DUF1292 domain-containing protein [bacterium]MCM1423204.1 DUF1292 domain-containing protein [bacterium]
MDKITFTPEEGDPVDFYVLEQTRIGGTDYLLVTESEEGDGEALILRDLSRTEEKEALYEIVDDDETLNAVAAVFEKIMDDVDIV